MVALLLVVVLLVVVVLVVPLMPTLVLWSQGLIKHLLERDDSVEIPAHAVGWMLLCYYLVAVRAPPPQRTPINPHNHVP